MGRLVFALKAEPERFDGAKQTVKEIAQRASESKPNGLQKLLKVSNELAAVIGAGPLPRSEVVSKVPPDR